MAFISKREQFARIQQAAVKVEELLTLLRPVADAADLKHIEDTFAMLEDDVLPNLNSDADEAEGEAEREAEEDYYGVSGFRRAINGMPSAMRAA